MSEDRPAVPDDLVRAVMIEAGYRCAIATCRETSGLQIDHIEDWAKVREHKFENLIVLCAVCHARKQKSSDPRHINRASLKRIKANLMMLNGRYGDTERRYIAEAQRMLATDPNAFAPLRIHETMYLLVKYLIDDGLVHAQHIDAGINIGGLRQDHIGLSLSDAGRRFILDLNKVD